MTDKTTMGPGSAQFNTLETPKLEADKLIKELMESSQRALIDAMRNNGVSQESLNEIKEEWAEGEEKMELMPGISWQEYYKSNEVQKETILEASKQALQDFNESVQRQSLSQLAAAQLEPTDNQVPVSTPVTPDMSELMGQLETQRPAQDESEGEH